MLPYCLQTWLHHKQAFRCLHGFVPYVRRVELVRAGSVISKTFTPLYRNQSLANFHIYGCLTRNARWVQYVFGADPNTVISGFMWASESPSAAAM